MNKRRWSLWQIMGVTMMSILIVFAALPVVWAFVLSLRPEMAVFEPIWESPTSLTFENIYKLVDAEFPYALFNSFTTAGSATILAMILGVPAGFALAKKKMTNKFFASWIILMLRMAPPVGFVIPLFLFYLNIGLLDTRIGLIAAYMVLTLPFVVWTSWTSMSQIPNELIEAGLVDGASLIEVFIRIILPAARPGLVAAAVLAFLMAWNDFFFALVITRSDTVTAPVAIMNFISYDSVDWGSIALAAIVLTIPTLPITIFANKYIVQSLGGAVKG